MASDKTTPHTKEKLGAVIPQMQPASKFNKGASIPAAATDQQAPDTERGAPVPNIQPISKPAPSDGSGQEGGTDGDNSGGEGKK